MASGMLWAKLADGRWVRAVEVRSAPPAPMGALPVDVNRLSSVAFAILRQAPDAFRDGQPVPLRQWSTLTGYSSLSHIRTGLRELSAVGLVRTVAYDGRRVQYAGEPSLMWSPPVLNLAKL